MGTGFLPPTESIDAVLVRIKETYAKENVRSISQVSLRNGPRAFRIATLLEIVDPGTKEFHHYELKIDQISKSNRGWFAKPEKGVRLVGEDPDEIGALVTFLKAGLQGEYINRSGDVRVITGDSYESLGGFLQAFPRLLEPDKMQLIKHLLMELGESSNHHSLVSMLADVDGALVERISSASRLIEYSKARDRLKELVETENTKEREFQSHLEKNPWLFGSEFSHTFETKRWTRKSNLDFMHRRTVDGYLEIVEIKTAFREGLFIEDRSHNTLYPSQKLSEVLGQVIDYIDQLDRQRDLILTDFGEDSLKIRAKIIIGRDGEELQRHSLRNLNAHLHRIEVLTYDQLLRVSGRILDMFSVRPPTDRDEREELLF